MRALHVTTVVLGITCMFWNAPSMAVSADQYKTPGSFTDQLYLARGGEHMGGHSGGEHMSNHPGGEQMGRHPEGNPQINRGAGVYGGYGGYGGPGVSTCVTDSSSGVTTCN